VRKKELQNIGRLNARHATDNQKTEGSLFSVSKAAQTKRSA